VPRYGAFLCWLPGRGFLPHDTSGVVLKRGVGEAFDPLFVHVAVDVGVGRDAAAPYDKGHEQESQHQTLRYANRTFDHVSHYTG